MQDNKLWLLRIYKNILTVVHCEEVYNLVIYLFNIIRILILFSFWNNIWSNLTLV
jgi:hypothetical protein